MINGCVVIIIIDEISVAVTLIIYEVLGRRYVIMKDEVFWGSIAVKGLDSHILYILQRILT
jgi:hypothetical protein